MNIGDFRVVVSLKGSYLCCSPEKAESLSKELGNAPIEKYDLERHCGHVLKVKENACIG